MSSSICELINRQKSSSSSKMRTSKIDRNHAVFIERTREGDQFYSILATRSSSDSDCRQVQPPHRKQKRRHTSIGSGNVWRNIFLTGTFFLVLVLLSTMCWLVISMKFRLETLEVKVMRLANDVDSLLRTQLTWTSTQTTINSIGEQIQGIKGDLEKTKAAHKFSIDENQYQDITVLQKHLRQSLQNLEAQVESLREGFSAESIWAILSGNKDILCQITDCKKVDNRTDGSSSSSSSTSESSSELEHDSQSSPQSNPQGNPEGSSQGSSDHN